MRAGLAADGHPRSPAVDAVARPAWRQRQRCLIAGRHGRCFPGRHHVVWNWQAVAEVRSEPVRDQENQPAWPAGRPVAWSAARRTGIAGLFTRRLLCLRPAGLSHCSDQAAPLRGAGSGAPRAGLLPWGGPARAGRDDLTAHSSPATVPCTIAIVLGSSLSSSQPPRPEHLWHRYRDRLVPTLHPIPGSP